MTQIRTEEALQVSIANKEVVCIINTPFQLLSLLCLLFSSKNQTYAQCDLLVSPNFDKAQEMCNRLSTLNIFNNVWCGDTTYLGWNKHLAINRIKDNLFTKSKDEDRLFSAFPEAKGKEYDVLICSFFHNLSFDVKTLLVPNGISIFIDDGAGSHCGGMFKPFACMDDIVQFGAVSLKPKEMVKTILKKLFRPVLKNQFYMNIQEIALFSPTPEEISRFKNVIVSEIPLQQSNDFSTVLAPDMKVEHYRNVQYMYLTLPDSIDKQLLDVEHEIINFLYKKLRKNLIIKPHPRRSIKNLLEFNEILAPPSDSWELLLLDGIIDEEKTLIGYASSAQVHPKTLCNIEPKLVFLAKIFPVQENILSNSQQMIVDISNRYSNTNRIFVPKTLSEFQQYFS